MHIEFWVDPACPFCWLTARWMVDEVQPNRDVQVTWRPISLYFKNEPPADSEYHDPVFFTHRMLRVMESVRATNGNDGVFELYWELGTRIHHDRSYDFTAADALEAVGLDTSHAAAFDDESWDDAIRAGMDDGLSLVGNDVGTPIIAIETAEGRRAGYFGPVINKVPPTEASLAMWDGLVAMMSVESFFELKRTRSGGLDFGTHPTAS